jgi:hypothetical protein
MKLVLVESTCSEACVYWDRTFGGRVPGKARGHLDGHPIQLLLVCFHSDALSTENSYYRALHLVRLVVTTIFI